MKEEEELQWKGGGGGWRHDPQVNCYIRFAPAPRDAEPNKCNVAVRALLLALAFFATL